MFGNFRAHRFTLTRALLIFGTQPCVKGMRYIILFNQNRYFDFDFLYYYYDNFFITYIYMITNNSTCGAIVFLFSTNEYVFQLFFCFQQVNNGSPCYCVVCMLFIYNTTNYIVRILITSPTIGPSFFLFFS